MKDIGAKLLMALFVSVFAAASAFLSHGFVKMLANVERVQSWPAVEGELVTAELITNQGTGDDVDTRRLKAHYRYMAQGEAREGSRVDFSPLGADNFSDGRRARQQDLLRQKPLTVYVDPADPLNAVIDRSLPAEVSVFIAFFLLFPCGFATLVVLSLVLYPFKPLRLYAGALTGVVLGAPALWLLYHHLGEFGMIGAILLMLIGSVGLLGLYFIGRRFTRGGEPAL